MQILMEIPWEVLMQMSNPRSTNCLISVMLSDMRCEPFSKTAKNHNSHHTPVFPKLDETNIPSYLSGYTDGEGCFCISVNRCLRNRVGWEVRPSFSVSQNNDRAEVLNIFQNYFGTGSIRPDRSDKTLKYEVRSIKILIEKVIPHFERFPLFSEKQKSFLLFKRLCQMVYYKSHLTNAGLREIVFLAGKMNTSGKRKYVLGNKDIVSAVRNNG